MKAQYTGLLTGWLTQDTTQDYICIECAKGNHGQCNAIVCHCSCDQNVDDNK